MKRTYLKRPSRPSRGAFSLLEMLLTLGLVGMLSGLVMPAVTSLLSSREFSRNAHEVADLLKYAQAEAKAKQSFVRVGFASCEVNGSPGLKVAAFFAADGSGENVGGDNLIPLSRVVVLENVALVEWSALQAGTRDLQPGASPASLGGGEGSPGVLSSQGTSYNHMVTFTPRGEALLKGPVSPTDGYDSLIDISLKQARGGSPVNREDAAVLIDGSTGVASVLKL